ncbi:MULTISPECIES: hypothetical protein [unclassified Campylobacter]|nr:MULTISPECIES: hypothetical protein [unclassified Campylobacter]MCX2683696.1 hypothetical protein [Campylobacter sp. MIT 21-1684]MCX2751981.1 hypothetical protein [Campylobacter sp. MIT 21-1682]
MKQHKPVVMIEIFERNYKEISTILHSYGYEKTEQISDEDYIFRNKN